MMIQLEFRRFMVFLFTQIGQKTSIEKGFDEDNSMFFILTNSRGFTQRKQKRLIGRLRQCGKVAKKNKQDFIDY